MNRQFRKFSMNDLFVIITPKKRINANTVTIYDYPKGHPYVVRTSQNNGIRGYIEYDEKYLNPKNTISFGQDTATMFYQERPYFTGDKIKILQLKIDKLNHRTAMYLLASMQKAFSMFSWGQSKFNVSTIGEVKFDLPMLPYVSQKTVYDLNDIDWDYMHEYIRELEQERIRELELYLKVTGLSNYELTDEEKIIMAKIGKIGGAKQVHFKISDLFDIKNSHNILKTDIVFGSGKIPYVTAGQNNNGIMGYIDYDKNMLENGNCIFIGGKSMTVSYQEQDFFSNDSHNLLLTLKSNTERKEKSQLFMVCSIYKSLSSKYAWNDSISYKKIQSDIFYLPICLNTDGSPKIDTYYTYHPQGYIPDFDFMEKYICAMQKKVIADVIKFKDQIISISKHIL